MAFETRVLPPSPFSIQQDGNYYRQVQPRTQGYLSPKLFIGGLFPSEEQDVSISYHAPSYLFLRLRSRRMWPRGGDSLLPASHHWWNRGSILGVLLLRLLEPQFSSSELIKQQFPARRSKPRKLEATVHIHWRSWSKGITQREVHHFPYLQLESFVSEILPEEKACHKTDGS